MDESHRLKPMVEGYDQKLFSQLYKETRDLRNKLSFEIDHRKFGVEKKDVISWFDIKFLHAFNRYYGDSRLKGYIINSLQTFKMRVVKMSYAPKFELHQTIDMDEVYNYDNLLIEEVDNDSSELISTIKTYFKKRLSDDAYFIFDLDLNPPPYIIHKMENPNKEKMSKIPAELIAEYLDIPFTDRVNDHIKALRKEVELMKLQAKEFFSLQPIKQFQST